MSQCVQNHVKCNYSPVSTHACSAAEEGMLTTELPEWTAGASAALPRVNHAPAD